MGRHEDNSPLFFEGKCPRSEDDLSQVAIEGQFPECLNFSSNPNPYTVNSNPNGNAKVYERFFYFVRNLIKHPWNIFLN